MRRRTLLRVILGAAFAATAAGRTAKAAPAAVKAPAAPRVAGGSGTAKAWQWVALPNSGGLQVHCTHPVAVTWTAQGVVTAAYTVPLTVTAPAVGTPSGVHVNAVGPGYAITVRRRP